MNTWVLAIILKFELRVTHKFELRYMYCTCLHAQHRHVDI